MKYKDAHFTSELFIKIIEEAGVYSCVQMITNNELVCKVTGIIRFIFSQNVSYLTKIENIPGRFCILSIKFYS